MKRSLSGSLLYIYIYRAPDRLDWEHENALFTRLCATCDVEVILFYSYRSKE